jgi:hypothetical protein
LPRTAPIARAIAGIGIGQASAASRTAPIARAIAGIGIGQASAARTTTPAPRPIHRISICDRGKHRRSLHLFSAGVTRRDQQRGGGRKLQNQETSAQRALPRLHSYNSRLALMHHIAPNFNLATIRFH